MLIRMGKTIVLCTASVAEDVPRWMRNTGRGWVTTEYSMLPGASPERIDREAARGRQSGRTHEIQRLIGRSLRAVTDLEALGEVQITLDCDVLQADGMHPHGQHLRRLCSSPRRLQPAAQGREGSGPPAARSLRTVSASVVGTLPMLDLAYSEDSKAEVDMNVVMTASGRFVEVQGTAEGAHYCREPSSTSC